MSLYEKICNSKIALVKLLTKKINSLRDTIFEKKKYVAKVKGECRKALKDRKAFITRLGLAKNDLSLIDPDFKIDLSKGFKEFVNKNAYTDARKLNVIKDGYSVIDVQQVEIRELEDIIKIYTSDILKLNQDIEQLKNLNSKEPLDSEIGRLNKQLEDLDELQKVFKNNLGMDIQHSVDETNKPEEATTKKT